MWIHPAPPIQIQIDPGKLLPSINQYPLNHEAWAGISLVAQLLKNPPEMQETWVQSLGLKDPLEKRKASYSSILAWRIPWTL